MAGQDDTDVNEQLADEAAEAAGRERVRRGEGEQGHPHLQVLRGKRHDGVDHGGSGTANPVLAYVATDGP